MKKLLALVLLLVMTLSMAACGGSGGNEGGGGGEKKDDKITLGFNTNGLTNETMSFMADVMKKYCDEHGFDFMVAQDDGEISKMQNNLENMVAGGCDGIIFMNYDPPAMEKVVLELKDKIGGMDLPEGISIADVAVTKGSAKDEAIMALQSLGFSKSEASTLLLGINDDDLSAEDYVKLALRSRR